MLAKYNNNNQATDKPFIETNKHLSHENYERVIQKEWLTDGVVALFLDSLNLDLNHSHQINDQAVQQNLLMILLTQQNLFLLQTI